MVAGYDWFQPSDLPTFFHALQKAPQPAVLVGGQSLAFWVDYFRIPVPITDIPYLTQDADVLATKHDARIVAATMATMGSASLYFAGIKHCDADPFEVV